MKIKTTTATQTFYKEGGGTETTHSIDWETINKETTTSLSRDNSEIINNDTTDNQGNLIESDIFKNWPLKDNSSIGQMKDDRRYISSNEDEKLQDNFLKIFEN